MASDIAKIAHDMLKWHLTSQKIYFAEDAEMATYIAKILFRGTC